MTTPSPSPAPVPGPVPGPAPAPAPAAGPAPVSALDQLEIQELVTRYNHAIDRGDVDAWVECFTPDGAFEGIFGRIEGRAALHAFATALATGPEGERFRPMRHWTTNFVIDLDGEGGGDPSGDRGGSGIGDHARMRADHLLVRPTRAGVELLLLAVYRDRLRRGGGGGAGGGDDRGDGGWRFSERVVEIQGGTAV